MGEQFGPYELQRLLGRGGMGEVFEAYDSTQDRQVAVKRLVPHLAHDTEFQRRFRRESRLAARLRNPHVVPIHSYGEIDGRLFIDMRLVEGCDLEELISSEGPLPPARAVDIIGQVASALDAAHHEGLIHRDIKPSNALIDRTAGVDEFVYLADFGITRALGGGESQSFTTSHAIVGSLDYMAPEQFDGIPGPGIDIYSLGCVLFQCLTGTKPFMVEGLPALMHAHMTREAPLVSERLPGATDVLDEVVSKALEKDPAERFGSAGELAEAARAALASAGRPVLAGTAPSTEDEAQNAPVVVQSPAPADGVTWRESPLRDDEPDLRARATSGSTAATAAQVTHPVGNAAAPVGDEGTTLITRAPNGPTARGAVAVGPGSGRRLGPRAVPAMWLAGTAALVVLAVLLTGLVVSSGGSSSEASTPAPAAASPAAQAAVPDMPGMPGMTQASSGTPQGVPSAADAALAQLGPHVPATVAGCHSMDSKIGGVAHSHCASGAFVVSYDVFSDAASANAALDRRAAEKGASFGECGKSERAFNSRFHQSNEEQAAGRLVCYQPADGAYFSYIQDNLPSIVTTVELPGTGDVHHELAEQWEKDTFGPRVDATIAVPRGVCSKGECGA